MTDASLLAACDPIIGCITPPEGIAPAIDAQGKLTGPLPLFNTILQIIFIGAGLWSFFNFIIAGFDFLNAGGDAKLVGRAWTRIWQSTAGLIIIVTSFLFAAVIGMLVFGDPTAILKPSLNP